MEKLKVSQIAQTLGVSNQTVYNYLSKFRQDLEGNLIRENGKQYLNQDGFKILKNCLGKPDPVEGVKSSQNLESLIVGLKETMDALIRQHAEERAAAAEERRRSDTIILKLTNDIGNLQKRLEYRP
ncbi:MAG: helix-turn-helix domain containing protein, partial [Syntrophales bacterium]|nr:helix-turn-helix domain containing protein [Syntrophales bacterium]